VSSVSKISSSSGTIACGAVWVKVVIQQCGGVWVSKQSNAPPASTVGTVRTAQWFKLFALYRYAAFAAISSAQVKGHLVNE
jgi:hypothetical protein